VQVCSGDDGASPDGHARSRKEDGIKTAAATYLSTKQRVKPELNDVYRRAQNEADSQARGDGRGVIEAAFHLLDHIAAGQPVRAVDLAAETGIPRSSVYRLLQQLIVVGAVRRDGARYRLGTNLLALGSQVAPAPRLRLAARRPMADLAAATGAAVSLSGSFGDKAVLLDTVEGRFSMPFIPKPGHPVPPGTAQERAHATVATNPVVDSGSVISEISCVSVALPLGSAGVAAVTAIVPGIRPPVGLVAATRSTAARIAGLLREPIPRPTTT
jgi:hypothetical protein